MKFSTFEQLIVMLFAQLSGQTSLRDLEVSFDANPRHHLHHAGIVCQDPQGRAHSFQLLSHQVGLMLDPDAGCPTWFQITSTRFHDSKVCDNLPLATNASYVSDRAYNNAAFRVGIETVGAFFLFFKWIKQSFNIKRFVTKNPKAIRLQIITALIAHVLLKKLQRKNRIEHH